MLVPLRWRSTRYFGELHASCARFVALRDRAKAGVKGLEPDLLIARIEMGALDLATANKEAEALGKIGDKQQTRLTELLLNLEVDAMARVRSQAQAAEAGRRFTAMWDAGRVPSGRSAGRFFSLIMEAAYTDKDVKLFTRALRRYEVVASQGRRREAVIEGYRKKLELLKGKDRQLVQLIR